VPSLDKIGKPVPSKDKRGGLVERVQIQQPLKKDERNPMNI